MRNAVIRKKRLRAERIVDDYMRMPTRVIVPHMDIDVDEASLSNRLWSIEQASLTLGSPYLI